MGCAHNQQGTQNNAASRGRNGNRLLRKLSHGGESFRVLCEVGGAYQDAAKIVGACILVAGNFEGDETMLNPEQAILFHKCCMSCFDNKEFVLNWERLRQRTLRGEKNIKLFINDVRNLVFDRLPMQEC